MEKNKSDRSVENSNEVLGYHKEVFIGEIKRVQMVDGIMIFELQKTLFKTLQIVVKRCFHTIWGVKLVTRLKNDLKL